VLHEGKDAKSMTIKLAEGSGVREVREGLSFEAKTLFIRVDFFSSNEK
jgi:hypothetical protein